MTTTTNEQERQELAEIRALTRARILEALRNGQVRASFLAQVLRFLSECEQLKEPPQEKPAIAPEYPFKDGPKASETATSEPEETPQQARRFQPLGERYDIEHFR